MSEETEEHIVVQGNKVRESDTPAAAQEEEPAPKPKRKKRAPKKVKLRVIYSRLNYKGTIYDVGDILELSQADADELLEVMSGRPRRHLEYVD